MTRDIIEVIDAIAALVPETERKFKAALREFRDECEYAAPECWPEMWSRGARTLRYHISLRDTTFEGWRRRVVEIWRGRSFETPAKPEPHNRCLLPG